MQKGANDIFKAILELNKNITKIEKNQFLFSQEMKEVKSLLRTLDRKITNVLEKIQEFEIIIDTMEIMEEADIEEDMEEDNYDTEWTPEKDMEDED